VAFLAAGEMAFAYFLAHVGSKGMVWNPLANGGEAAVLFCFAFLALFFLGGGKWSVDAACKKK
jgi:putative oxidoreductase